MWVIVRVCADGGYSGVLDNDPGIAEGLNLRERSTVEFGPEHIIDIGAPLRDYLVEKYGPGFFAFDGS